MSTIAIATLQTPWDCKWSRFGRMQSANPDASVESLWVCVHDGVRRPIDASTCETCAHWEYEAPLAQFRSGSAKPFAREDIAACPCRGRAERRLEIGTRVVAFALAALLGGLGVVVLTRPLAIPLTISLWMGALASFFLSVWGRFNRQGMRAESW